jgi:hypothetical protein
VFVLSDGGHSLLGVSERSVPGFKPTHQVANVPVEPDLF